MANANDSLVQWAIINFGGSVDPSLKKAASELVNLVGGITKATQTEAEKLVGSFGKLQGGVQQGMGTAVAKAHENVLKLQADLKQLNASMDQFDAKQKRRNELYAKGSKTFTLGQHSVYAQSKSIVSQFGSPQQIANDITRIENEMKRYEKLVARVKKGEVLGPKTHIEFQGLSQRNFTKEIEALKDHGKQLEAALNNIDVMNKVVMKRLSNSERKEWAQLVKDTGAGMSLLVRMTTQKSKELEAARIDLERKFRAASNRTLLLTQQFRNRVTATQTASDMRTGFSPTKQGQHFYDQAALKQLQAEFAAWIRDSDKINDRLRRFAMIHGENHKAVKASRLEWQLIGEMLLKEIGIAEQQVRNSKVETEELKKQAQLEKQISAENMKQAQFATRHQNRMTDIAGSKSGTATRSQLSAMLKDISAIEAAQKKLRQEINDADPADKKFISGKKATIKALEATKVELGKTYIEHKKLREEIEKKTGKSFLDGFTKGIRGGGIRSVFASMASEFKRSFADAFSGGGGVGGGIKAGLGALGGFGAGFGLVAVPIAAIGTAFNVAKGLANGFFNTLKGGLNTLGSFIQQATAARQEIVQFSLATGLAMKEAEQINAVFRTWGLDTYWTAMSLEGLNKVIMKNSKALTDMGIASRDASGNARKVTDVLKEMREIYHSLDDSGKRNFLSNLQSTMPFTSMLLPLITGDFDKTVAMLEKMNVIMSETDSGKLVQASAAMQTLKMSGLGLANAITSALAPALVELANGVANLLANNMDRIKAFFEAVGNNIASFINQITGFFRELDIVNSIANGMIGGQGSAAAGKGMELYQNTLDDAKETADDLADSIEGVNEQLEDQNDILADIRDAMDAEIEVVNDLKEAEKDAFEGMIKPIEKQNKALEKQIDVWQKLKAAALDAINIQIKSLTKANDQIKKNLEAQTKPWRDRLKQIAKEKKAAGRAKEAALDGMGEAPESGADMYKGQIDELSDQNKTIDKQIKGIRDGTKAFVEGKNDEIEAVNDLKEAIKDQQDAITDARDAFLEGIEDQIDVYQDQIDAIHEVSEASADAARLQEYYDRRAYLMGQTLLAQAEQRARSLSVRQERMRNSGESDVDYQLRMQQLNATLDIEDLSRQDELRQLDLNHATEMANAAIDAQIGLIEDQIEALRDLADARKESDETTLEALRDQTEAYDDQIEAIRDLIDTRQEADSDAIESLEDQKEAINEQIESLREAQEAAKEAADAAKDAWDAARDSINDAADAQMDALEDEADALQDLIDAAEEAADAEIDANDDVIDSLNDKKDAIEEYYDALIKPLQDVVDANKEIIDQARDAHDEKMEQLDDEIERIRDRYEPEIDYQEQIIKNLQRQRDELNDLKKIQDKIKTDADAVTGGPSSANPGTPLGGPPSDDNIGAKIGKAFFDTLIAPFLTEAEKARIAFKSSGASGTYEDYRTGQIAKGNELIAGGDTRLGTALVEGPSTKRPDLSETIMQVLADTWDKLEPHVDAIATEVSKFLFKVMKKSFELMGDALGDFLSSADFWIWLIRKFNPADPDSIAQFWSRFWTGLFLKVIDNMIEKVIPGWDNFFEEFFKAGNRVIDRLWDWMFDHIVKPILKFVGLHEDMVPVWEKFWEELYEAGVNVLSSIGTWLWDHIGQPIVDFIGNVIDGGGEVTAAYLRLWSKLLDVGEDVLKTIGTWLWDHIGKPIVGFISDGIQESGEIGRAFFNLFDSFFKFGFTAFKNIGQWLWDTIGNPMVSFFTDLPTKIGTAFSGLWGKVSSPIRQVFDGFKNLWNGVAGFVNKISGALGLSDSLIPTFTDTFQEPNTLSGDGGSTPWDVNNGFLPTFYAKGGYVTKPTMGVIGEGGHDEVILTTDPKQKKRTAGLLRMFLGKMAPMGGPFDAITDPVGDAFGAATDIASAAKDWAVDKLIAAADKAISGLMDKFIGGFRGNMVGDTVYGIANHMKGGILGWLTGKKGKFDAENILDLMALFGSAGVYPTQSYGKTAFAQGTYANDFHSGVDIASGDGSPIPLFSPGAGSVLGTGDMGNTGYGKWIQLALGSGTNAIRVFIGHMSEIIRKIGDSLTKGTLLGNMGTTGFSTGIHAHIEVRDSTGNAVNPAKFFPAFNGFWGSDLLEYAKGGVIRPNSTLIDAGGKPYAKAGEGGLLETVTPVDFLKGVVRNSVSQGIRGSVVLPQGQGMGNTYSFTVGDVYANTKEDAQHIAGAIRDEFNSWLDQLPAHAKPTEGMGVR